MDNSFGIVSSGTMFSGSIVTVCDDTSSVEIVSGMIVVWLSKYQNKMNKKCSKIMIIFKRITRKF